MPNCAQRLVQHARAADCLQPPLVPRCGFRQRLTLSVGPRGARARSRHRADGARHPSAARRDQGATRGATCTTASPRSAGVSQGARGAAPSRWRRVSADHTRPHCPAAGPRLARQPGRAAGLTPQRRDGAPAPRRRRRGQRTVAGARVDGHHPEVSARASGAQAAGTRYHPTRARSTWSLPPGRRPVSFPHKPGRMRRTMSDQARDAPRCAVTRPYSGLQIMALMPSSALAAFVCDPSAGSGVRYPDGAGTPGAQGRQYDDDLHPSAPSG